MLSRIFIVLAALAPAIRQLLWKALYQRLAAAPAMGDIRFMNYGYRDRHAPELEQGDEPDRPGIQLYERVVRHHPLDGLRVVEVGCGRGYGSSYLARYHAPVSMIGIDLSEENIRLCRDRHRGQPHLAFETAAAAELPLADRSIDVVVNVESSHCYPDRDAFRREVYRVLEPGGLLLWADLGTRPTLDRWRDGFEAERWERLEWTEITDRVIDALDLDAANRSRFVETRAPRWLRRALADFAGVRGGAAYRAMASGRVVYCVAAHRKRPQD